MADEKQAPTYGALIHVPGLDPEKFLVSVVVQRRDGAALTESDLAAAEKALPRAETFEEAEEKEQATRSPKASKKRKSVKRAKSVAGEKRKAAKRR